MSGRFTRLYYGPERLYAKTAPAIVEATALLRDSDSGKLLAQVKMKNISGKSIRAVRVAICAFDAASRELERFEHSYDDLHAGRDVSFGQQTPVFFTNRLTRSFEVRPVWVGFEDGSQWFGTEEDWEPLPEFERIEPFMDDAELLKQYRIRFGQACSYKFDQVNDLWYCSCGAINRMGEDICHNCANSYDELIDLDMDELRRQRDERLEEEGRQAEEEAEEKAKKNEERKRKVRKYGPYAAAALALLVAAGIAINMAGNKKAYNAALEAVEAGDYVQAASDFEALGGYKDSEYQHEMVCLYIDALEYLKTDKDAEAYECFVQLDGWQDSEDYLADFKKMLVMVEYNSMDLGYYNYIISYSYDEKGFLKSEKTKYFQEGAESKSENIYYENDDRGNALKLTYSYPDVGVSRFGAETLLGVSFVYDDEDRMVESYKQWYDLEEKYGDSAVVSYNGRFINSGSGDRSYTYTRYYNEDGELISDDVSYERMAESYDAREIFLADTVVNEAGDTLEFSVRRFDPKSMSLGEIEADSVASYEYDEDGNCIKETCASGTTYNKFEDSRCVESRMGNSVITFEYDGEGNRIRCEKETDGKLFYEQHYTYAMTYVPEALK